VAELIKKVTGVSYHPGRVWYILRDQLGWTWQRPARRAVERRLEHERKQPEFVSGWLLVRRFQGPDPDLCDHAPAP
jgi:hypothetical protein